MAYGCKVALKKRELDAAADHLGWDEIDALLQQKINSLDAAKDDTEGLEQV